MNEFEDQFMGIVVLKAELKSTKSILTDVLGYSRGDRAVWSVMETASSGDLFA